MRDAELARLVAELFAAYPHMRVEATTLELYERHLARCDRRALVAAVDKLIETRDRLPTIADVRECVSSELRYREMRERGRGKA